MQQSDSVCVLCFDGVEKRAEKTTSNRVLRRIIFMNVGNILIRLGMINRLLIYEQFVAMHMKFFCDDLYFPSY